MEAEPLGLAQRESGHGMEEVPFVNVCWVSQPSPGDRTEDSMSRSGTAKFWSKIEVSRKNMDIYVFTDSVSVISYINKGMDIHVYNFVFLTNNL